MERKNVCSRCKKEFINKNVVVIKGVRFGVVCAKEVKKLIAFRSNNRAIANGVCPTSECQECFHLFNCVLKSYLATNSIKLDMFNDS